MDKDGTKSGFDLELYQAVSKVTQLPIIASGGVGSVADFTDVFEKTSVTGALAASVFHYGEIEIPQLKEALAQAGVEVRR